MQIKGGWEASSSAGTRLHVLRPPEVAQPHSYGTMSTEAVIVNHYHHYSGAINS
jgi:hypothetical protein